MTQAMIRTIASNGAVDHGFNPEAASLVAVVGELFDRLRANAATNEEQRNVCGDSLAAIRDAGLWGLLVPQRWGGLAAPSVVAAQVIAEIARACPSTGWVFEIYTTGSWMPSLQADAVQEEVYADGVPLIAGSTALRPGAAVAASARRVDGGVVVSGTWDYASGCKNADWGSFGMPIEHADGETRHTPFLTPFDRVRIVDSWNVAGMLGTGSHSVVIEDLFVPDHLVLTALAGGHRDPSARARHGGSASDFLPFNGVYSIMTAAVLLGAARGALDEIVAKSGKRGVSYTPYARQVDSHVAMRDLGEAAMQIDAAEAVILRSAEALDRHAERGEAPPVALRQLIRGRTGHAGKMLRDAVETLMSIGGASGFAQSSILQRHWRDLAMSSRHAVINSNAALEFYGRALAGVEPPLVAQF